MKVVKIEYPTALSKIKDIRNDNIDVFVELEDGTEYVVVVSTPQNFNWYMDKESIDFFCGVPSIIVRELTKETIEEAIHAYASDEAYWLKYYHLSGLIDTKTLDQFVKRNKVDNDEIMSITEG